MAEADDLDIRAAEFALGLLEGDEHVDAQRLMVSDPNFSRAVENWRMRLSPLGDAISAITPPDGLWNRIEAALGNGGDNSNIVVLLGKVRRWKAVAVAASGIAASLALALLLRPDPLLNAPAAPATLIAQVGPSDARAILLASYDQSKAELLVAPATIIAGKQSAELWVIPDGDKPHSLGLIGASGLTRIVIPAALRATLHNGATIAVSLEPEGGSPTGQPTGPVIATGKFIKI